MAAQLPNNHPLHLGFESANQSKVPERQRYESRASAREFGCFVSVRTRRTKALSIPQVFWDGRAGDGAEVLAINRTIFPAMQLDRIAGVWALCFAYFHLCQQMKVGRPSAETDGLPP
jgi:hypothetical protein